MSDDKSRTRARRAAEGGATAPVTAVVLADTPERARLRELQALLDARRDEIADLDLDLETLQGELADFEQRYRARLAEEHEQLKRIERLCAHAERWIELLRKAERVQLDKRARRLEARRARELAQQIAHARAAQAEERDDAPDEERDEGTAPPDAVKTGDERLKAAFRALARRFHPDLARTEDERVSNGEVMTRINALYRAGQLGRLEDLAEQAKGGEIDAPELDVAEQTIALDERLAWFDTVLGNLRDERAALERSPSCELMRNVDQAELSGRDLVAEVKAELHGRVARSYPQVASAVKTLEAEVNEFNKKHATGARLSRRRGGALERRFDPFADKRLVRLGLEELQALTARPEAKRLAAELEPLVERKPAVLRLVLLTYVAELSPFPLAGLETFAHVAVRYAELSAQDAAPLSFEQALVEADHLVAFGVKRQSAQVMHTGLRFSSELVRDAVPLLLTSMPIRREFKRVLGVVGEQERCEGCDKQIYAVPLFRTRGLDDLRALVCPSCGATLRSYWMPRGQDVQAVLNGAFIDFELCSEWSFRLARGSFGVQLLPMQVDELKVRDLVRRLFDDVFAKYEIGVTRAHLELWQGKRRVAERTALATLEQQSFTIRFAAAAELSEADALEMLRHRVRSRFRGGF